MTAEVEARASTRSDASSRQRKVKPRPAPKWRPCAHSVIWPMPSERLPPRCPY
jgi:hypothetical protein